MSNSWTDIKKPFFVPGIGTTIKHRCVAHLYCNKKTSTFFLFCFKAPLGVWGTIFIILCNISVNAQTIKSINLEEAKQYAISNNRLLKISRYKEQESEDSLQNIRSRYYPNVDANGLLNYNFRRDITFNQGEFGTFQGSPIPDKDYRFKTDQTFLLGSIRVSQPLTQLTKISTGVKVAETNIDIARLQTSRNELQVSQGVEKLYYGILLAQQQKQLAALYIQLSETQLYDVESALLAGTIDSLARYGLQAQIANQRQKQLQAEYQLENYTADFIQLLGLPDATILQLQPISLSTDERINLTDYLTIADTANIDIKIADKTKTKASLGVTSAKKEYIPDVSLTASYSYQDIIPVFPKTSVGAGVLLTWKIFDWGTRKSLVNQRTTQQKEATEYFDYLRQSTSDAVKKAYRSIVQAANLVKVAEQAVSYRKQEVRFATNRNVAGYTLKKDVLNAQVNLSQAETDLLSAQLNYRMSLLDLNALTSGVKQQ